MTEKEVVIYMRGRQTYEEMEADELELTTEGTMTTDEDGGITLFYRETELTGMGRTATTITLRGDRITLERTGDVSSQMIFQKGIPHSSLYETPWGAMTVDITTSYLAHRLGEHGGVLEIRFAISVGGQVVGYNTIKIRVREKMR